MDRFIKDNLKLRNDRFQLWSHFINENKLSHLAELGVYKGDFAKYILDNCEVVEKYYMIDPWRNLEDWNKPANTDNDEFEIFYNDAIDKTNFASEKRIVLRGKTTEVINKIEDKTLDFIYIDGDHTLKGITIDLITSWNKVKEDGFIAGDDFCPSIWQHSNDFEPTLIFPFVIYFAEAMNVKIYALPFNQFVISKKVKGYEFINWSGKNYDNINLLAHINQKKKNKVTNKWYNFLFK